MRTGILDLGLYAKSRGAVVIIIAHKRVFVFQTHFEEGKIPLDDLLHFHRRFLPQNHFFDFGGDKEGVNFRSNGYVSFSFREPFKSIKP